MSDISPFYEIIAVEIKLGRKYSSGEVNRIMKEAGATLHYDVYGFEREDVGPIWQSESYLDIVLFCNGEEVDAQESVDKIELQYPMATISTSYITKFVKTAVNIASQFNAEIILNKQPTNYEHLILYMESIVTEIMEEWGEEPGSELLRILIEQHYN